MVHVVNRRRPSDQREIRIVYRKTHVFQGQFHHPRNLGQPQRTDSMRRRLELCVFFSPTKYLAICLSTFFSLLLDAAFPCPDLRIPPLLRCRFSNRSRRRVSDAEPPTCKGGENIAHSESPPHRRRTVPSAPVGFILNFSFLPADFVMPRRVVWWKYLKVENQLTGKLGGSSQLPLLRYPR